MAQGTPPPDDPVRRCLQPEDLPQGFLGRLADTRVVGSGVGGHRLKGMEHLDLFFHANAPGFRVYHFDHPVGSPTTVVGFRRRTRQTGQ